MDLQEYRDEVKLNLTGYAIDMDIDDSTIDSVIQKSFREIQRYIRSTILKTVPYSPCIDMSDWKVNAVLAVYRTNGFGTNNTYHDADGYYVSDPMQAAQWQILSSTGNLINFQTYMSNYASWSTLQQIRNTMSTDLAFRFDANTQKLYINYSINQPVNITIEYLPIYNDISDVKSYYWVDNIIKLAVALCKVVVGRVRSRYTLSNAQWTQDGETLLNEGNAELAALREHLINNSMLTLPID